MAKKYDMDITIVLDRSGSMASIASDAEGGLRQFVADQKKTKMKALFTLAQFDDEYEVVYDAVPLSKVGKIKLEPRSMTALLDAMGKTIKSTEERLKKMKPAERPSKVLFAVVTDGHENASTEWKRDQVFKLIKKLKKKWQFVFLAANQDAIVEGGNYGYSAGSSMTYAATGSGIRASINSLSCSTCSFYGSINSTMDNFFTDDAREEQDELLKEENN